MSIGKLTYYAIFFLFITLPLIHVSNTFNPYESPKFIVFLLSTFLLFILHLKIIWKNLISKSDILTILIFFFGAVVYISDILGIDPKTSFLGSPIRHQGFITLLSGILLFIILRAKRLERVKSRSFVVDSSRQARTINYILLGAFLVCIVAIWQGIAFYVFSDFTIPTYQGRIVGTIGNPNSLAGYLVTVLPFVFAVRPLFLRTVLATLFLTAIIFTDSRSAFLAVAILFLVYVIRLLLKLNLPKIATGLIIILAFLGLIKFADYAIHKSTATISVPAVKERGCPESWPTVYPWKLISDIRNSKIFNVSREAPCDNRLLIWVVGLETLSKRPILGFGQENFEIAVPPGKMHNADNAHNIFLETTVSSGVIGLLLFVAIIVIAIKKANFTIKMSLLAFLTISQFNPLSIAQISLFWFLLAMSRK